MRAKLTIASSVAALLCLVGCGEPSKPNVAAPSATAKPAVSGSDTAAQTEPTFVGGGKRNAEGPLPPIKGGTTAGAFDFQFVPSEAGAAIVVFPRRVLTAELVADPGLKEIAAKAEADAGFSPLEIDELLGLVINGVRGGPGLEARMSKPLGGEAFVRRAMHSAHPEKAEFVGKTYFRPPSGLTTASCIFLVDDQTFLMASEPQMKLMLAAKGMKTPLVERLEQLDPMAGLSAIVTDADLLKMIGQFPPPFKPEAGALDHLTAFTLTIKTMPEVSIDGVAEASDEASAVKISDFMRQSQKAAQQLVPTLRQMLAAAPPQFKSAADFAGGRLDNVVAGLAPRRTGQSVSFEIRSLGTIDQLAKDVLIPITRSAAKSAHESQIIAEIAMLDSAMKAYKAKYVAYPPSDFSDLGVDGPVGRHLAKPFPRCNVATELAAIGGHLTPAQALVFWLGGHSADPEHPISGPRMANDNNVMFLFDQKRLIHPGGDAKASPVYVPPDGKNAPYVYFAAQNYEAHEKTPFAPPAGMGTGSLRPYFMEVPADPSQQVPINPSSFQIISAGIDGDYGAGAGSNGPFPSYFRKLSSGGDLDNLTNLFPRNLGEAANGPAAR